MIDPQDLLWLQVNLPNENWEDMDSHSLISKILDHYKSIDGDLIEEESNASKLERKINRAIQVLEGQL